jgi:hypothetical protein
MLLVGTLLTRLIDGKSLIHEAEGRPGLAGWIKCGRWLPYGLRLENEANVKSSALRPMQFSASRETALFSIDSVSMRGGRLVESC